jgi:hypothetical protein
MASPAIEIGFATYFESVKRVGLASEVFPIWMTRNYLSGSLLEVDELVRVVDTVLRCGANAAVPSVTIMPRPRDP